MRLLTLPGVFRPRSDSWMLATALAERVQPGQSVLDPFTGSGILAIAAARYGLARRATVRERTCTSEPGPSDPLTSSTEWQRASEPPLYATKAAEAREEASA